jgi:hypothetical protein
MLQFSDATNIRGSGATSQQFDAWFNTWTSQGYTAVIVEATGSPGLARFAAVMENFNVGGWTLWTGVQGDEASFIAFDAQERLKGPHGRKLVWLSEYGSPSQRLVCGIWHNNPTPDKQWWYLDQPKDDATRSLNVQMTKPFWRPFRLSGRPGGLVTAIYEDTWVGHGVVQLGQTYAELSSEWYRQQMQGRRPVFLAAAGNDVQDVVYHSVWAEQANPSPRQWRATGTAHGFRDNDAAINSIDTTMKQFMQATGIRQAQVAVGKNGAVLLERAYSWSEPEKHTTVSTDRFLLASVSKMFCAAAIKTLVDSNKLTMQTKPWHLGGYPWVRPLTDTADIRVLDITIANLLDHEGGWDRQKCDTCDILFKMRDIAKTTNGGSGPPSLDDFVWYLHSVMLDFAPGTRSVYSNVGYVVLSKVVEHVSGMKYFDYLKSAVLDPLGIGNDVQMWLTDKLNHVNDPITQESSLVGLSVLTPNSNDNFVADVFGGDGLYKETALGSSSLSASASTLVKFMARFCKLASLILISLKHIN